MFFRLDKRDVCCRPTAYSRHPFSYTRTASASVLRLLRRAGAGKAVFSFDSPSSLPPSVSTSWEAGCGGDDGVSGRGAPSAYRRDLTFVGLNAQRLASRPVLCYQASAAIVARLTNSICQAAAALAYFSLALRSRAEMIARESDLDMLAARCSSDRCVIKLTCG